MASVVPILQLLTRDASSLSVRGIGLPSTYSRALLIASVWIGQHSRRHSNVCLELTGASW